MLDEKTAEVVDQYEDIQEGKYLSFRIDKEEYGIAIRYVTEIIGIQSITTLPDMPQFVKGVINLRGRVIPVIDIRLRFSLTEREYDGRTCIIVVNLNNTTVGLIVDSVREVIDIPDAQIDPPPSVQKGKESRFIQGLGKVGEQVKIILDAETLLFEDETALLSKAAEQ